MTDLEALRTAYLALETERNAAALAAGKEEQP